MIDPWRELKIFFNSLDDTNPPEIEIGRFPPSDMRSLLVEMLQQMRGVSFEFYLAATGQPVWLPSPDVLADGVVNGLLVGAVSGRLTISGYRLPEMLFIVESARYLVLSLAGGRTWQPIDLIAVFEWLRNLNIRSQGVAINMDTGSAFGDMARQFNLTVRAYLHDTP